MTQSREVEAYALTTDCSDRASTRLSIKHAVRSLPWWPGMTAGRIDEVAAAIRKAAEAAPNPATDGRAETG
jgi:hypothetical protein